MNDLSLCHPRLQALAARWLAACTEKGIFVAITETLRTAEEQDYLYAQGRTRPGPIVTKAKGSSYRSQHQWGIAFDFRLNTDVNQNGTAADDSYNDQTNLFEKAASIGKELGLGWGGDWKSITDKPHLYLPDWGSTTAKLIEEYGTPGKFMETWEAARIEKGFRQAKEGNRWWYQNEDGTYAADGWFWLKEITGGSWGWYLFDPDGYMLTGLQTAPDGRRYFLCPDKGVNEGKCMVTDNQGQLIIADYDLKKRRYLI